MVSTPHALAPALADFGFSGRGVLRSGKCDGAHGAARRRHPCARLARSVGRYGFLPNTADGTPYKLVPGMHVVVADGYDSGGVYVADPATGGMKYFDWSTFMSFWNVMDGMGLSVSPL